MKFRVEIVRQAEREFQQIVRYIAKGSKPGASAWVRAFEKARTRLEHAADSFPRAPEDEFVDFELREILFQTRRGRVYRALFTIRQDEEVQILHIRGAGQDLLAREDFE